MTQPNDKAEDKLDALTLKVGEFRAFQMAAQVGDMFYNLTELQPYLHSVVERLEKESKAGDPTIPFFKMIVMFLDSYKQAMDASPDFRREMEDAQARLRMMNMMGME